ncbi:12509_t:CDS:2, partial [Cetraspora pellucida]
MANLQNCLNTWFEISNRTEDNLNNLSIWIELYKSVKLENGQRIYATKNFYQRSHFANIAIEIKEAEITNYNEEKRLCFGKYQDPRRYYKYDNPYIKLLEEFNIIPLNLVQYEVHIIPR